MRNGFIITTFLFIVNAFSSSIDAQNYRYEVGAMLGTSFYMGDANQSSLFKNPGPAAGVIFRYNHDFRWSMKYNLAIGHVSGDTKKSGNAFPYGQNASFSRNFLDAGCQIEYNFFNFSDRYSYLDTKPISPYVFVGVGFTMGVWGESYTGMNIPFGLGLKYKWKDRFNLGFEFSLRKLFGDNFDVTKKTDFDLDSPYDIKSSFFKNKDWYSMTMISLTWEFGPRCKPCLNIE